MGPLSSFSPTDWYNLAFAFCIYHQMRVLLATNYRIGQTGEFASIALSRMGIDMTKVTPSGDAPEEWTKVSPQFDVVEFVEKLDDTPDLFLMVESSTGEPFLPRNIEKLKIPTAIWLYDNYLNFRWNKEIVSLFDYAFFAQKDRLKQATRYGCKNLFWLPFAADEEFHKDFCVKRDIDIGYLGTITDQKRKYFADLENSGLTVLTNARYLSYEEIGRFYSRCKLVYNISARRDMNVRTFEASAAGALVVNQSLIDEGCFDIFTEGENMAFHDFNDAARICRDLLADERRRSDMAKNAIIHVMKSHTYRHRMEKLLEVCSGGITDERRDRSWSFLAPMTEALTCNHRDFGWGARAYDKLKEAVGRSLGGVLLYLAKYFKWRIKEKIEKLIWSLGKAPV